MTASTLSQPTLAHEAWHGGNATVRNVTLAILGSLALWASAKMHVPFYPVPMTMQSFVVLFIGMSFGWRLGAATVLLYLAQGAMGLPVFSGTPEKGIGIAYMLGTTGGYLLGFALAAGVVGALAQRGWDRNVFTTFAAMLIGNVVIYVPGLLWLGALVGWDKPVLAWGMTPFLLGDLTKILLASAVLPLCWQLIKRKS
ncbi:MAG: biotin transporter BioY [Alphaproteobacteria bacterium]|nr:biotin transporter BioY [Alphaproteobacteria bacterium]